MYRKVQSEFKILAPSDGMVIYEREWSGEKKTVGSVVRSWDPVVAKLPDLSVMESGVYINEVDIQKIKKINWSMSPWMQIRTRSSPVW